MKAENLIKSKTPELILVTNKISKEQLDTSIGKPCPPDCAPNNDVSCTPNDCSPHYN